MVIDGELVKAQIWDTAGQERFKTFSSIYYSGAQGVILTYDVTKRETFENIGHWVNELVGHLKLEHTIMLLLGNKTDLEVDRQVQSSEGQELAKKKGFIFLEVSALMNTNGEVSLAFVKLIEGMIANS